MLAAIAALTLTGCNQAPQAEQKQPETKPEVNGELVLPPVETPTTATITNDWDPNTTDPNPKYKYDNKKGVLVDSTDDKILYTNPNHPDSVLAILGMEGDIIIVWETSSDNSPGPCYWDEIWVSDSEKSHITYLDLKNLSTGLQPYTIPEYKYNQEKIDIEACSNAIQNDADANTLAQKIEGDSAWTVGYFNLKDFPAFTACDAKTTELTDSLKDTKAGFLDLYNATDIETYVYNISLIRTDNPDQLTKEELKAIINPCSELGSNEVLMATKDAIYWGYPYCSGGAVPANFVPDNPQSQDYLDYQGCLKIQSQIIEYFGLNIAISE